MKSMWRYWATECLLLFLVALGDFLLRRELGGVGFLDVVCASVASAVVSMLIASLVFLLGDFAWLVAFPTVAWCGICTALEWFFQGYFRETGFVGGAFVMRYVTMSWASVWCFLVSHCWSALAVLVVLLLFLACSFRLLVGMHVMSMTLRSFAVGIVLLAGLSFALPWTSLHDYVGRALADHVFLQQVSNSVSYELARAGDPAEDVDCALTKTNVIGVVVLGESSTSAHWSLYGYARKTTPNLDLLGKEMVVFADVKAMSYYTLYALRDILTWRVNGRAFSLPSLALASGYACSFCSSQGAGNAIDNNIGEILFRHCRPRSYTIDGDRKTHMDDAVLPLVDEHLNAASSNQLVFVQMYGSHTPWDDSRIPASAARYSADYADAVVADLNDQKRRQLNAYDNTVVFTDSILARMIDKLRVTGRPSFLIFFSDHGETPRTFSRDTSSAELSAIPVFIWTSPEYRKRYPDTIDRCKALSVTPLESSELFPIFADVLGLKCPSALPTDSETAGSAKAHF